MKKNRKNVGKIVSYSGLFVVTLISFFPFLVMMSMSTHTTMEVYRGEILSIGTALWENICKLAQTNYFRYYFNSFYVAVAATILSIVISCLCGYGLAVYEFKLKKAIFMLIMATMMVPSQVGMIGFVLEMRKIGWVNTHIPLIFATVAWPFGVFWIRQFVTQSIPMECLESARIDGGSELRIFMSIAMPFLKPAIASLAMIAFLASWNSFLMPMMVLNKDELFTLQLGIRAIGDSHVRDIAVQIAGLSLGVVPILLIFVFGSRHFISGLTEGAVKG